VWNRTCVRFFQLGTGQTIQHAFKAAGFHDVSSDRFNVYLRYESDKEAIVGAFLGSAVALAYRKFDEQTKEEAHAEYIESIQPYWNASAYEISSKFVIVAGRK